MKVYKGNKGGYSSFVGDSIEVGQDLTRKYYIEVTGYEKSDFSVTADVAKNKKINEQKTEASIVLQ